MNPFGVRREDIGELIGSEKIASEMVLAGWIKPVYANAKMAIYDRSDIGLAFQRLRKDGRPKIIRKARKAKQAEDTK